MAEPASETPDVTKNYPLEHEWTMCVSSTYRVHRWVGKQQKGTYGDSMVELCDFKTVQEYAQYWNMIPPPSSCFSTKSVEALCIFKKGIKPEWEDEANASGGEWQCRQPFDVREVDVLWEALVRTASVRIVNSISLVMGLVGEQLDTGDEITGARIVDKSRGRNPVFRLELWYRDSTKTEINEALKNKLLECLKQASGNARGLRFDAQAHNDKKW